MATSKIAATVMSIGWTPDQPDGTIDVIVQYVVAGAVVGEIFGYALLRVDATQNDAQITNDLRTQLAAYVDPLISPNQGFAANDVRGLNL
jgi:hypothetical protein